MMRYLRRFMIAVLVVGLATAFGGPAGHAETVSSRPSQPYLAIDSDFPDPALLHARGAYFAYSTNSGAGNMPAATSDQPFGEWTRLPDALPELGSWASTGMTWAPDVTELADGTFLVYYTARDTASQRQCLGAATAATPAGPFTPLGDQPLVCPVDDGGAIDAAAFVDSDGTRYLTYKNDGNAIGLPTYLYLQQVAADGVTFIGEPIRTMQNDPDVEGGLIEAPYLVERKGRFYMFYSYGQWWNDTYTTGYAVADSLEGPWQKATEPLMTTQSMRGLAIGPGGASFLAQRRGGDLVTFHGVRNTPDFYRGMYVAKLAWRGATPVVRVK